MKNILKKLAVAGKNVLKDLAKLKLPVTAAATATTIVGILEPFGIDLSTQSTRIAGALAALGLVVTYVQQLLKDPEA